MSLHRPRARGIAGAGVVRFPLTGPREVRLRVVREGTRDVVVVALYVLGSMAGRFQVPAADWAALQAVVAAFAPPPMRQRPARQRRRDDENAEL